MKRYFNIILGAVMGGLLFSVLIVFAVEPRVFLPSQGGSGTSTAPSAGQVPIGNTSSTYTPAFLTAGSNITISTSSGAITIAATVSSSSLASLNRSACQSSNYTVATNDIYICTTGTSTITLLTAVGNAGRYFIVKDEGGVIPTSTVRIIAPSGQTIDGLSSTTISSQYGAVNLISDGANYFLW